MKKLAVLVMIPALAMLMVPALASANWYSLVEHPGDLRNGRDGWLCPFAEGFTLNDATATLEPLMEVHWWTSTYVGQGTFTFDVAASTSLVYHGVRDWNDDGDAVLRTLERPGYSKRRPTAGIESGDVPPPLEDRGRWSDYGQNPQCWS